MTENTESIQEHKSESLRKALIEAGYDMASSQVELMTEDIDYWGEYMIEGKINPKCIDIGEQASHSFYSYELDSWVYLDENEFPEAISCKELYDLIEKNGISDEEVFVLLDKGQNKYIIDNYGEDWKEKYPEPDYN